MRTSSLTLVAALSAACSSLETGTITVPLAGQGPSGITYRLRHAELIVVGDGATQVFHTEQDPDRDGITAALPPGDYTLAIPDGWYLDRQRSDGTFARIDAVMTSANPVAFTIAADSTTQVTLRFLAGTEDIPLDDGTLDIELEVDELADAPPPPDARIDAAPPDASLPDAAVPPGHGAPLATGSDMLPGEILTRSTFIQSGNLRFGLRSDGRVEQRVMTMPDAHWTSPATGDVLIMQLDGNLVLYRSDGTPTWASQTHGRPGATLQATTNGARLYHNGTLVWALLAPPPG